MKWCHMNRNSFSLLTAWLTRNDKFFEDINTIFRQIWVKLWTPALCKTSKNLLPFLIHLDTVNTIPIQLHGNFIINYESQATGDQIMLWAFKIILYAGIFYCLFHKWKTRKTIFDTIQMLLTKFSCC